MTEHDLMHKLEEAIRNIFLKNENQPLSIPEIILGIEKELGNGEIDAQLTAQIIEGMQEEFYLLQTPTGKLVLNK